MAGLHGRPSCFREQDRAGRMDNCSVMLGRGRSVLLAAVLLLPLPHAEAYLPTSCGYDSPKKPIPASVKSCSFRLTGTPIQIEAYGIGDELLAPSLRIWVTPGANPETVLVECSASGAGSGGTHVSCRRNFSPAGLDTTSPNTPPWSHISLECNIEIQSKAGGFRCSSPETL